MPNGQKKSGSQKDNKKSRRNACFFASIFDYRLLNFKGLVLVLPNTR